MKYLIAKKIPKLNPNSNIVEIKDDQLYDLRCVNNTQSLQIENHVGIKTRNEGDFKDKSFWLNRNYDWIIARDNVDEIILIPVPKEK